jgi:hypothetical protein
MVFGIVTYAAPSQLRRPRLVMFDQSVDIHQVVVSEVPRSRSNSHQEISSLNPDSSEV